jgi:hypothetical protein
MELRQKNKKSAFCFVENRPAFTLIYKTTKKTLLNLV